MHVHKKDLNPSTWQIIKEMKTGLCRHHCSQQMANGRKASSDMARIKEHAWIYKLFGFPCSSEQEERSCFYWGKNLIPQELCKASAYCLCTFNHKVAWRNFTARTAPSPRTGTNTDLTSSPELSPALCFRLCSPGQAHECPNHAYSWGEAVGCTLLSPARMAVSWSSP